MAAGIWSGRGEARARVTTLYQVVDTAQMGHRGSQYGKKGEVHHERPWLLSSPGTTVRLQERPDRGCQLRVLACPSGLHPGGSPGGLRLLRRQSGGGTVDRLETRGRRGG